jgi:hypothetical protein
MLKDVGRGQFHSWWINAHHPAAIVSLLSGKTALLEADLSDLYLRDAAPLDGVG